MVSREREGGKVVTGTEVFDGPECEALNLARVNHALATVDMVSKTVLDAGCGVGHLGAVLRQHGAFPWCVDARPANIERLRTLYPNLNHAVVDVESGPAAIGPFDVVFCCGLLYHLESPLRALRNLASALKPDGTLYLETIILRTSMGPTMTLVEEGDGANDALRRLAHRPSALWVLTALRALFREVAMCDPQPDHPDFTAVGGKNTRASFVARAPK